MAIVSVAYRKTHALTSRTHFRRLLTVSSTPDWYAPEVRRQIRSALIRPVARPRGRRGLLEAADPVVSTTRTTSGLVVNVNRTASGITAASLTCAAVFGGSGSECALFNTQVRLAPCA